MHVSDADVATWCDSAPREKKLAGGLNGKEIKPYWRAGRLVDSRDAKMQS